MTRPADAAFRALERRAVRPLDPHGNARRELWLSRVAVDAQGCWIWTGQAGSATLGRRYPQFYGPVHGRRSAITWLFMLWAPELLADVPQHKRQRRCGKFLCVRPACLMPTVSPTHTRGWDIHRLKALREAGCGFQQCSDIMGVNRRTLEAALARNRWLLQRNSGPRMSRAEIIAMYRLWHAGRTPREIAAHVARSKTAACVWSRKFRAGYDPTVSTAGLDQLSYDS